MPGALARRTLLAGLLALAATPLGAAESGDCGCGPKSKPQNRAEHFYQMALAVDDPAQQRRLAELALSIWPQHTGAAELLNALTQ